MAHPDKFPTQILNIHKGHTMKIPTYRSKILNMYRDDKGKIYKLEKQSLHYYIPQFDRN